MPVVQNEKALFEGRVYVPTLVEDSCQWFQRFWLGHLVILEHVQGAPQCRVLL
jgi:hypothetical protein